MASWRLYRSHGRELILRQLGTPPPTVSLRNHMFTSHGSPSWSSRSDSYSATPLAFGRNIVWQSDSLSTVATALHTSRTHPSDNLDSGNIAFDESVAGSCTIPLPQPYIVSASAGCQASSARGREFDVWNQTSWRVDSDGAIVARQGGTQTRVPFGERQCQVVDPAVVECLKKLRKQMV